MTDGCGEGRDCIKTPHSLISLLKERDGAFVHYQTFRSYISAIIYAQQLTITLHLMKLSE
jgi:hypothetical protein